MEHDQIKLLSKVSVSAQEQKPKPATSAILQKLTLISTLGGFLFGYDTGVISGVLPLLKARFDLSPIEQETIVTSTVVTAAVAALLSGFINKRLGRRKVLLFSSIIFTAGSLILAAAPSFAILLVGRLVVGVGIGFASMTSPLYIAECSTADARGRLVTINTIAVCIGQFIAGMVDCSLSNFDNDCRWMLGLGAVPSILMLAGFLNLPESPRWLIERNRLLEAENILKIIRGSDDVEGEIEEVLAGLKVEMTGNGGGGSVFSDAPTRRALTLGCGLMLLQQFAGINTVMYYAASIYEMSGFEESTAIWLSGFTSLAQVLGVATAICLVESKGRRTLLLSSLAGVFVSLVGLGGTFFVARKMSGDVAGGSASGCESQPAWLWDGKTSFCSDCNNIDGCSYDDGAKTCDFVGAADDDDTENESCENPVGIFAVLCVIAYLFLFGIGLSAMPWTINSEIFPQAARSQCVAISTTANWVGNILVSATFLSLSSPAVATPAGAFWMYATISALGFGLVAIHLPETKGKSLEEIAGLFR